mgnify:CR=1 FL=1
MKAILGILVAAGILGGIAVAQPAEAACRWNGYAWHCWHPGGYGYPGWRHPHPRWHHHGYWRGW